MAVVGQVAAHGVKRGHPGGERDARLAEPTADGCGNARDGDQQVEREVPVGEVARLARMLSAGGPAEGVERGTRRVERDAQLREEAALHLGRPAHCVGHPDDEALVRVDVLVAIPVDVGEAESRADQDEGG